ncbi:MAG: DUF4124 domain-containing protein [Candidatus Berkiella sp.]
MKKLTFTCLSLFVLYAQTAHAQTVYKGVDKQGNVVFSDNPIQGGEKITITPPPPVTMPAVKEIQTTQTTKKDEAVDYKLSITSPQNQQTFNNDVTVVPVLLSLSPKLQPGDRINLIVNGKPYGNYSENLSFELKDFPRGAYTVNAVITSEKDPAIIKAQSDSVTFYQQRAIAKRDVAPNLAPQGKMAPQAP